MMDIIWTQERSSHQKKYHQNSKIVKWWILFERKSVRHIKKISSK